MDIQGVLMLMCLPLAVLAGISVNRFSVRRYTKRWQQVLVVILGFGAVMFLTHVLAKLTILQPKPGSYSLGAGLAAGIGMGFLYALLLILGALLYIISSALTSVACLVQKRCRKA